MRAINSSLFYNKSFKNKNIHMVLNKIFQKPLTESIENKNLNDTQRPMSHNKIEEKKLIFYYNKIEFQTSLSRNVDISLKDFLNVFASKFNFTAKKSYKDYQMFKNGYYAPNDFYINRIETYRGDPSPLILIDFDLTFSNFSSMNITNYKNPSEFHSNKFQVFLNSFLEKINLEKFNNNHIHNMIKSNKDYYLYNTNGLNHLAASLIGFDNPDGVFKFGQNFDLTEIERNGVFGLTVLNSKNNNFIIPITLVKNAGKNFSFLDERMNSMKKNVIHFNKDSETEQIWNEAILENLNIIRKISLKNKLKSNFGIVTDFSNWRINYYIVPNGNSIENNDNYHSSLKYHVPLGNLTESNGDLYNFVKIIKGLASLSKKEAEKINLGE